jgi:hypothetical protein
MMNARCDITTVGLRSAASARPKSTDFSRALFRVDRSEQHIRWQGEARGRENKPTKRKSKARPPPALIREMRKRRAAHKVEMESWDRRRPIIRKTSPCCKFVQMSAYVRFQRISIFISYIAIQLCLLYALIYYRFIWISKIEVHLESPLWNSSRVIRKVNNT